MGLFSCILSISHYWHFCLASFNARVWLSNVTSSKGHRLSSKPSVALYDIHAVESRTDEAVS